MKEYSNAPFRDPDEWVTLTESQRKDAVAEVVPVNDHLAPTHLRDQPYDGKGRDTRRILASWNRNVRTERGEIYVRAHTHLHKYELRRMRDADRQCVDYLQDLAEHLQRSAKNKW